MSDEFKNLTADSRPWSGNEVKPFTKERLYKAIRESGPFGEYCIDRIEKEEKEQEEEEK